MPPGKNVDRAVYIHVARLSLVDAGLCVEGSLVTRCDRIYLFASVEEVDALEVSDTSPTR